MPQPLMCCDKAFHIAPSRAVGGQRTACQHHLEHMQKLFRYFQVALIAGVMKGDQDLVREAAAVARCSGGTGRVFPNDFCFRVAHNTPRRPTPSVSFGSTAS
jgi:hypothetical protein